MQYSAKSLQNNPTLGVGTPPQENPGSATDSGVHVCTVDHGQDHVKVKFRQSDSPTFKFCARVCVGVSVGQG